MAQRSNAAGEVIRMSSASRTADGPLPLPVFFDVIPPNVVQELVVDIVERLNSDGEVSQTLIQKAVFKIEQRLRAGGQTLGYPFDSLNAHGPFDRRLFVDVESAKRLLTLDNEIARSGAAWTYKNRLGVHTHAEEDRKWLREQRRQTGRTHAMDQQFETLQRIVSEVLPPSAD